MTTLGLVPEICTQALGWQGQEVHYLLFQWFCYSGNFVSIYRTRLIAIFMAITGYLSV